MRPNTLAGIDVPGLHFTYMISAGSDRETQFHTHKSSACFVFHFLTQRSLTEIVIGRDINHPRRRTESDRRPVLAAPQRWAVRHFFSGARLVVQIDLRPPGFRIQALEYILGNVRLALDEMHSPAT